MKRRSTLRKLSVSSEFATSMWTALPKRHVNSAPYLLCFLPPCIVISFPDLLRTKRKARSGQIQFALRDHLSGMWQGRQVRMPNIFGAVKAHFVAYNKLTTGLRHDLRMFARSSEFPFFHETKQAQNEVERFFPQLGRICFRILLRQSENFSEKTLILRPFQLQQK